LARSQEERKKTSVHLVRGSAFVGVHFRQKHLIVTIKSDRAIKSPRVLKSEQVSRNRWHSEVKGASDADYFDCGETVPSKSDPAVAER
jgi:hypothetical protein